MREIQDVSGNLWDIAMLFYLEYIRKKHSNIRETAYLKDFATLKTFDNAINPKYIIRDTLLIYLRNVCDIYKKSDLLQECVFKFSYKNEKYCFEYSNNMMFSDDIAIMCLLYYVKRIKNSIKSKIVQVLMSFMKNKYGIYDKRNMDDTESTQEQNKISLYDIIFSYPSISWEIMMDNLYYFKLFKKFNDFNIPKVLLLRYNIPLLPKLNQAPPLAVLLLIELRTIKHLGGDITTISLYTILAKIYILLMRQVFPQCLKLELCEKWQIVEKRKKVYKYASCFATYRQKAKDMIAEMKPDDSGLKSLLAQL